jgi:hypothetical protein
VAIHTNKPITPIIAIRAGLFVEFANAKVRASAKATIGSANTDHAIERTALVVLFCASIRSLIVISSVEMPFLIFALSISFNCFWEAAQSELQTSIYLLTFKTI